MDSQEWPTETEVSMGHSPPTRPHHGPFHRKIPSLQVLIKLWRYVNTYLNSTLPGNGEKKVDWGGGKGKESMEKRRVSVPAGELL